MKEHKYILEPYKGMNTRYRCPQCKQKQKSFSFYINTETGAYLHESVGRCNRESKCGYHYTPKQYFQDNDISLEAPQSRVCSKLEITVSKPKPVSFVSVGIFKASLNQHKTNHFVKYLVKLFDIEITGELVSRYFIATSNHWQGATVFWQIDSSGKIRTGKIMLYNPASGKRVKEPFSHISWVHSLLKQPEFELKQCLFGEHLLKDKSKAVAIVESEKTAIIASAYLPQFIWLAVGSLSNLNAEKCSILKGRSVTLFPDLNGFEKWSSKAKELSQFATFTVSDLLERKTSEEEKKQGFDLADYLTKFDFRQFAQSEKPKEQSPNSPDWEIEPFEINLPEWSELPEWSDEPEWDLKEPEWDLEELESRFSEIKIPAHSINLNHYSTILNVPLFVESHFTTLRNNKENKTFLPFLRRLNELLQYLIPSIQG